MKGKLSTVLLIAFGLLSSVAVLGQTQLFGKFHFEDGGYTLVGIRSESDKNTLADSLGDFYTDDVSVLNAIKKAWVFRKRWRQYACGYHYDIVILKNGKEVQSHGINLNCNQLTTENGSLYFDTRLLSRFKKSFKKLYLKTSKFDTLPQSREFWTSIQTDKNFVYADEPNWLDFDGSFGFLFKCTDPNQKCFDQREVYFKQIRAEIEKAYIGEKVDVRMSGASGEDLFFDVQSKRTLYDKFNLYKLDKDSYYQGQWKPYPLYLYSYWKTTPDLRRP